MRQGNRFLLPLLFILTCAASIPSFAGPPFINYQGVLETGGEPVADSTYIIEFRIWDSEVGGTELWFEEDTLSTKKGRFRVKLGRGNPISDTIFLNESLFLGIWVDGDSQELDPRSELGSVPHAFLAKTVPHKSLGKEKLKNKSIVDSLIDNKAIGKDKIKNNAIVDSLIENKAIGKDKIKNNAIVDSLISDGAVKSSKIADGSILFEDLHPNGATIPGQVMKWDGGAWALGEGSDSDWVLIGSALYTARHVGIARVGNSLSAAWDSTEVNLGVNCSTDGEAATVGGGKNNGAMSDGATVSGGFDNMSSGIFGVIGGGVANTVNGYGPTIGGGSNNAATFGGATVSGGDNNRAEAANATVSGGTGNEASGSGAVVGGGVTNFAPGQWATIGGGHNDTAYAQSSTVAGGSSNGAMGNWSTIGGGSTNQTAVSADYATIAGGGGNDADGQFATIGGGNNNQAGGGWSTIGGGEQNLTGNAYATVPGGWLNEANGVFSFAAGNQAHAEHTGSIVLSACTDFGGSDYIASGVSGQMVLRADNMFYLTNNGGVATSPGPGIFLYTTTGGYLSNAGNWTNSSDRGLKENFRDIDGKNLLDRIDQLEISRWNYRSDPDNVTHIGPTAQEFRRIFDVGESDVAISTIDPAGIALAAIQELNRQNADLRAKITRMEQELAKRNAIDRHMDELLDRIDQLESALAPEPVQTNTDNCELAAKSPRGAER